MSKPKERQDPIAALEEWHDHQYTPGHYIGGRLPPYLLGKRPNLFGCVPLAAGLSMVGIMLVATIAQSMQGASPASGPVFDWTSLLVSVPASIISVGIIAVLILSGIKLLRKPSKKVKSH
jgi:hypothetical protein